MPQKRFVKYRKLKYDPLEPTRQNRRLRGYAIADV